MDQSKSIDPFEESGRNAIAITWIIHKKVVMHSDCSLQSLIDLVNTIIIVIVIIVIIG
jgi:hypothetical protein